MKAPVRLWKESASLIILARDTAQRQSRSFDYNALVFRRPETASFMPNSVVFPGGAVEPSDRTQCWRTLFTEFGVSYDKLTELLRPHGPRPFIYQQKSEEALSRDISLRLTAIRETFEEVGILLCRSRDQIGDRRPFSHYIIPPNNWQHEVHNDSSKFIDLCRELKVLPDLWSMYEWADWLTPTTFRGRRFETAFYLVALNEMPLVVTEKSEVHSVLWDTPDSLVLSHLDEKIWLPPPQLYELSRLRNIKSIDECAEFAQKRNLMGTKLFFPVQLKVSDALVHVLPGDHLYPKEPDYDGKAHDINQYQNHTADELRKNSSGSLHRTEHSGIHKQKLFLDFPSAFGHLDPIFN